MCFYDLHLKVYCTNTGKYFHTILIVDFLIINHLIKECPQCHVQYDNLVVVVAVKKLSPIIKYLNIDLNISITNQGFNFRWSLLMSHGGLWFSKCSNIITIYYD